MKHAWRKFLNPLTAGVRVVLAVLGLAYAVALVGRFTGRFNLYDWLALHSPSFWDGAVWPVLAYALLPVGPVDFLINGFMLAWLGVWLERVWSRGELWSYCLICAAGAGLAKVVLLPASPRLMVGTAGVVFGLLVAWARLFGHERVRLMDTWEMSVRATALLLAAFSLLLMLPCAGPINAFVLLCGGIAGGLYLWLRSKTIRAQRSRLVPNQRMERLEL
jgi:membrane associated rhomboid family serine protease